MGRKQHGSSSHGESKQDAERHKGDGGNEIENGAGSVKHGLGLSG
jgi:hypothetical protein